METVIYYQKSGNDVINLGEKYCRTYQKLTEKHLFH